MSGNKKNNGVHEVGTTEITAAYKGDTPGQTVDEYLKLAAAKNVEKKKERSKNFSQVFDNPLKGFPYNEDFTVRDVNEEVEAFMEGMDFWKVTVTKNINKLKKGRSVIVKARNSSEALKKGAKNMGDPQANMSGYMVAVKDTKFPTNTSATQGKRMGESDEIDESSEAWVLVQNRKIIKKFKTKPSNSAFTSSDNQTLMTVSKAAKMGIKESLDEKKDSPKEFEKKVVHTMMIMKKYPANKNKSDAVLRKGAIKYLTQKPRGASDDWDEGLEEKWSMGDGKPRGGANIENVRFWDLPKASLEYIQKDSQKAMKANPSNKKNTEGKGNYADQINDAQTVLIWRKKNGIKESLDEEKIVYQVKGIQKPESDAFTSAAKLMKLKVKFTKGSGGVTLVQLDGTKSQLRKLDGVVRGKSTYGDPSTAGQGYHFDESFVMESAIQQGIFLDEGKMGDLFLDIQQGMTAKDIAKNYPVSLAQAKEFLKDYYSQKPKRRTESVEGDTMDNIEEGGLDALKRKFKRDIKKYENDGYFKNSKANQAFMDYALDNGEIKTDDPDEFEDWMDRDVLESLSEGKNLIPDFQEIVNTKGAKKIGGIMVDMFTASVITQAYEKVSDKNKAQMENSDVKKLVGLAQRIMGMKEGSEYKAVANPTDATSLKGADGKKLYDTAVGKGIKEESQNLNEKPNMDGQKLTGQEISVYFRKNKVSDEFAKLAVKIALDHGGAMSFAIKKIEKLKKGLSKHKDVKKALDHANFGENTLPKIGIKFKD